MDIFENLHALQNSTESKIPDNMEAVKEDINYLPSRYIELGNKTIFVIG